MFTRIVVGTDGSDTAREAVRQAIELAKLSGATCASSAPTGRAPSAARRRAGTHPPDVQYEVGPREDVNMVLDTAAAEAKKEGIDVQTHAVEGDPAEAILSIAEQIGADLIVVGNKGMAGARRFLLGSVPNKVSHHAPCSVIIIRTT